MPYWCITFTDSGRPVVVGKPEASEMVCEEKHASKIKDGRTHEVVHTNSWDYTRAKREMKYNFLDKTGDLTQSRKRFDDVAVTT